MVMRAKSSAMVSSLVAVMSALMSGCSPDEPPPVEVVSPAPTPPEDIEQLDPLPQPRPAEQIQVRNAQSNGIGVDRASAGQAQDRASLTDVVPQRPRRLVFECSGGVTFAVHVLDNRLRLFAPGLPPNSYLVLNPVTSASGMHYRAGDMDFRSEGDLATLEIGRERYVDCVANPAASVWEELERPDTATR
jgi:membrane-bound inhibitor of C-type lysozyme